METPPKVIFEVDKGRRSDDDTLVRVWIPHSRKNVLIRKIGNEIYTIWVSTKDEKKRFDTVWRRNVDN